MNLVISYTNVLSEQELLKIESICHEIAKLSSKCSKKFEIRTAHHTYHPKRNKNTNNNKNKEYSNNTIDDSTNNNTSRTKTFF